MKTEIKPLESRNLLDGLNLQPIPLEFSQKLTTVEWLAEIEAKLNGIVVDVNDAIKAMEKYYADYDEYFNNKLDTTKNELLELLNNLKEQTETAIANCRQYTDEKCLENLSILNQTFKNFREEIYKYHDNSINQILGHLDAEIYRLEEEIKKLNYKIVCPIDGRTETIQVVINHLFDIYRQGSLTAEEFDLLQKTVAVIDAYAMTALQFDMENKKIML